MFSFQGPRVFSVAADHPALEGDGCVREDGPLGLRQVQDHRRLCRRHPEAEHL